MKIMLMMTYLLAVLLASHDAAANDEHVNYSIVSPEANRSAVAVDKQADDLVQAQHLKAAERLLQEGNVNTAIHQEIDPVIQYYERKYSKEPRQIYCSRRASENLAYLIEAAATDTDRSAIVIGPEWSAAYFMKGYALIELGQTAEARKNLTRAIELSPHHSQYLSELAHLYQREGNLDESQKLFVIAEEWARNGIQDDAKVAELTRALRGQGYNLVEKGELDQAEAKYQECLKVNPKDQKAIAELQYIQKKRRNVPVK